MASSNNSFELQAKADEWMDVTPTEEVLRAELARLQEAFQKCTTQLDSSRLENDLLKDRGIALENESKGLQSLLELSQVNLESTQAELANTRKSLKQEAKTLEASLHDSTKKHARSEEEAKSLEKRLSEANQQRASEASQQKTEVLRLERELKSSKTETKTHKDAAIRFAEDLRIVREDQKATKRELEETKEYLVSEKVLHSQAKKNLGTVATLAENLKAEKLGLERSLAKERRSRTELESKANALSKELSDVQALHKQRMEALQSELSDRRDDLNGSNKSLEILQTQLKDADKASKESFMETRFLKEHLATMEQGRHELLERQSELQESLEEARDQQTATSEELASTKVTIEKAVLERDTLRSQRSTYIQSSEKEAELEAKLLEQKKTFESRLRDIHAILGLKFTTVVQTEVRTIHKNAVNHMVSKSLKVPLLAHNPHQRQQGVKSS